MSRSRTARAMEIGLGQESGKDWRFWKRWRVGCSRQSAVVQGVNYATSPLLASRMPRWRGRLLLIFFALGSLSLIGRAIWVQVWNDEFFVVRGEKRYTAEQTLVAARGRILDRNGVVLASSVYAPSLVFDAQAFYDPKRKLKPKEVAEEAQKFQKLLALLNMSTQEFQTRVQEKLRAGKDGQSELPQYVLLRRQMDDAVVQQVQQLGLRGVIIEPGFMRRYPEGEAAAHVVGVTTLDRHADRRNGLVEQGKEGMELAFEAELRGTTGKRGVVRDGKGRVVEETGEAVDPRDGRDVTLTIDSRLQTLAYQRLRDAVLDHRAQGGSVVVLDAQSGDILALANFPSYEPEERRRVSLEQVRNRAVTDPFEPGSTVKPFVVSLALEKGLVRPEDVLDTTPFRVGNLLVNDGEHGRPAMSVSQIIQKSSNVGTARIAQRLESKDMGELYAQLGFGTKPAVGFGGMTAGRLRHWDRWQPVEKTTMSYGYGLSVSLLQIARAYTALARDGELAPLTLVKGQEALPATRVFQPQTARTMRTMLRGTVSPEGTAPKAQPLGYSAGGKTGTAKKLERGSYNSGKYRAWFAGMSPIDQPRLVVAVMVDEPQGVYYGGLVAAPVFKQIVEQSLRILSVAPDIEVKPQMVAQANTPGMSSRVP